MNRQMTVLLIVVSEIVLRIIVDTFDRIGNSPLPPRMLCFLNVVNFRLVFLSHRTVPIDPLLCNFAVSTLLCRDVFNANGHRLVSWSQYPRLFLFKNLTSHILQFFDLCTTECFTPNIVNITMSLLSSVFWQIFFCCIILLLLTTPKQSCPTHNLDCVTRICASISYDCWELLGSTIIFLALGILPPRRTPPCKDVFQCRQYRIWSCVACPLHDFPHAVDNCFWQKGSLKSLPHSYNILSFFHPCCFWIWTDVSRLSLSNFNSVQDRFTPGQAFASEAEYTVDLLHHSSAFHSPRYVFISVDLHVSPSDLVCTLHPLVQAVQFPLRLIYGESQNLELLLERQFVQSCSRPDLYVVHLLVSISACPSQTC